MLERLSSAFPFLLLAALAALTFWLDHFVQPSSPSPDLSRRRAPDYIVEQLSAVSTNAQGHAVYTLAAERMTHYPIDDSTHLSAPRLVNYRPGQAPVTITSREARVSSDGEEVYFHDDVKVTRAAYGKRSELVLRTSFLHVTPDSSLARTDQPVTITDAASVVEADGLELNNETRVLRLLSNVRGTYDPNKATQDRPDR